MPIERHELERLLANVVGAGDRVFTAGAIADDTSLDVGGQTRQALADVDKYLALCGSDKRLILSVVIWLADIRLRDAMTVAWLDWVDPAHLPARACIEAKMADPRCLVEIAVVAARDAK
jgi:enamine deaminase RidA (YjgF/YER057c/UK114 family)